MLCLFKIFVFCEKKTLVIQSPTTRTKKTCRVGGPRGDIFTTGRSGSARYRGKGWKKRLCWGTNDHVSIEVNESEEKQNGWPKKTTYLCFSNHCVWSCIGSQSRPFTRKSFLHRKKRKWTLTHNRPRSRRQPAKIPFSLSITYGSPWQGLHPRPSEPWWALQRHANWKGNWLSVHSKKKNTNSLWNFRILALSVSETTALKAGSSTASSVWLTMTRQMVKAANRNPALAICCSI